MSQQVKAVAMIIKNDEGEILLVQRGPLARSHHGTWENVGGAVEDGEDPLQAIKREVKEEIGVEVEVTGEALEMKDVQLNGEIWLAKVYEGKISNGTPAIQEVGKHIGLEWYSLDQLKDVKLSPYAREDFEKLGWI